VFLGVGAQDSIRLPYRGPTPRGCSGREYLKDSASGKKFDFGKKKVLVIGGGNVAMDVARTARRQGGDVSLICLETREEMPASIWEVEEAEHEGVAIVNRWASRDQRRRRQGHRPHLEGGGTGFRRAGPVCPYLFDDKTATAKPTWSSWPSARRPT